MAATCATARGEFLAGCRDEAPLLLGVAPFGMIYGIAALAAGVPAWLAQLASAVVFAGAAQLVIVQMLAAGAGFVPIALTSGLLNLRHVPDDEADDVRAMLDDNRIAFYETKPSLEVVYDNV